MPSITLAPPLASTGGPAGPDERLTAGQAGGTGGYHAPVTERDRPEAERPGVPRVPLVDDAPAIRSALRGLLEDAGIRVVGEAPDGAQGVVLTASLRPDVVLMDLRMPSSDGFQATERIVEAFPDVRVGGAVGLRAQGVGRGGTGGGRLRLPAEALPGRADPGHRAGRLALERAGGSGPLGEIPHRQDGC
jgi:CheY-like chemotaxis protein